MDVVLEVFDTFLLDRLYATIWPAFELSLANEIVGDRHHTPTFSSVREVPTPIHPASQFLSLEPSPYAYLSKMPRDNIYRQGLSLFIITWYGLAVYILET